MKLYTLLFATLVAFAVSAHAEVTVKEGDTAQKLYEADKGKAIILAQKNKEFILRTPGGQEKTKPEVVKLKVGQRLYVVNEEHTFVHNVYDESDASWLLKKQEPSRTAVIIFDKPGVHRLRCAIHPTMKTELRIEQ